MKIIESKEKLLSYLSERVETAYEIDKHVLLKDAVYNYPVVVEFVDETTDGFAYKVYEEASFAHGGLVDLKKFLDTYGE